VERGGRGPPGEALQLEVPARVEDVEWLGRQRGLLWIRDEAKSNPLQ
jgi:hypothetical protein